MTWQPIETQPEVGDYLVFMPGAKRGEMQVCHSRHAADKRPLRTIGGLFAFDMPAPTHWQPLPAPPQGQAMSDELKPCPFCGGQPEFVRRDVEPQGDPWYGKTVAQFVECSCGCALFDRSFHETFYEKSEAIAAWNRRTDPPQPNKETT